MPDYRQFPVPSALIYAGLDFVLTASGDWILLEVNDHPVGLSIADDFARDSEGSSAFQSTGVDRLCQTLCNLGEDPICHILPEPYSILGGVAKSLERATSECIDDSRIDLTINEFNAICTGLRRLGRSPLIADSSFVVQRGKDIFLGDGTRVGVMYRRCSSFPLSVPEICCVNDIRARVVCLNKLRTHEVLQSSEVSMPRTFETRCDDDLAAWVAQHESGSGYLIVKPVFGSASEEVRRIRQSDYRQILQDVMASRLICQEWIEPHTTMFAGNSYYFDVRVFVVAGVAVGGFARLAAAPSSGVAKNSPLAWLSTTGRRLPIMCDGCERRQGVYLSTTIVERLKKVSETAVHMLDVAITDLSFERLGDELPKVLTYNRANELFEPIRLRDRSST